MSHFADRLFGLVASRGPICAGIDPRPDALPEGMDEASWGEEVGRLLGPLVAVVKPQLAFFRDDWSAVERVARAAREGGALVIADCKRGDIDSTAKAYAERILGEGSPFDAVTVNPYLGRDALAPFIVEAERNGKGVFVLVRTTNPGAVDVQSLLVNPDTPDGLLETVAERVARLVHQVGFPFVGKLGLSSVGAVVGLTAPVHEIAALRALMPHAPFLMPGWGAQGGDPMAYDAAVRNSSTSPAVAIINASRSLTLPWKGKAPAAWREAIFDALGKMTSEVEALVLERRQ